MKRILFLTAVILSALMLVVSCDNKNNEPEAKTYKVIFNPDNGSDIVVVDVKEGDKVEKPADPEKTGYSFNEWQLNGEAYDFENPVNSVLILKAVWENAKYKVTFDYDNGTDIVVLEVIDGDKVEMPDDPIYTDSFFGGWYEGENRFDSTTVITRDYNLKAKKDDSVYFVNFDMNHPFSTERLYERQGFAAPKKVTKPKDPTVTGYTFKGWQLNGVPYDFNTLVTSGFILKATWEINKYKVTFDSDGGSPNTNSRLLEYNSVITEPVEPKKEGYTFVGWYDGDIKFDFRATVDKEYNLKAKWGYKVTFDVDGSTTVIDSQSVGTGEYSTKPTTEPTTTNQYKTFAFWSADGKNEFKFTETKITSDITLYAVWKDKYTVGDIGPAGGYIFYDCDADNTTSNPAGYDKLHSSVCGWRYLEAAPKDLVTDKSIQHYYGLYRKDGSDAMVGTSEKIGTGKENTEALVNAMGEAAYIDYSSDSSSRTTPIYAAKDCYDYILVATNGDVYTDWFLPSIEELNLMYENLHKKGIGSFTYSDSSVYLYTYWSSSEYMSFSASTRFFNISDSNTSSSVGNRKTGYFLVRPARRF